MAKSIDYTNRDFVSAKNALMEYAKTYFPQTHKDFTGSSPGSLFLEMSAYATDVLSFYLDQQTNETRLLTATEKENLFAHAYSFGYKPKLSYASSTVLELSHKVPSKLISGSYVPDLDFCLTIPNYSIFSTPTGVEFVNPYEVDFKHYERVEVEETNNSGNPIFYRLYISTPVFSAFIKEIQSSIGTPTGTVTVEIQDTDILGVVDIVDSSGNNWYEVDFMAQSKVFVDKQNNEFNNPYHHNDDVDALLDVKSVTKKFISRNLSDGNLRLEFGSGSQSVDDTVFDIYNNYLPTIDGRKLLNNKNISNLLDNTVYGETPKNTTLTIRYMTGGGVASNVGVGEITNLVEVNPISYAVGSTSLLNSITDSLTVTNTFPARGGRSGDSDEEIRQKTLANYTAQNRVVSEHDYVSRAISLPPKYGLVSKAFVDSVNSYNDDAIHLFLLSEDNDGKFAVCNDTLRENLRKYLDMFRLINQKVVFHDAFVVNIGVNIDITLLPNYIPQNILNEVRQKAELFLSSGNMNINKPLSINDLQYEITGIKGVRNVTNISIVNLVDGDYSPNQYDVASATVDGVLLPSLDPCIFEVKYPETDIKIRIVSR